MNGVPVDGRWYRLGSERERVVAGSAPAADDGAFVVGWSLSSGRRGDSAGSGDGRRDGSDRTGFLANVAQTGDVHWEHTFDPGVIPEAVAVTADGPVVAGASYSSGPAASGADRSAWLAAFAPAGGRRWERGYPNGVADTFEAVVATSDGVVAGGQTGEFVARWPDGRDPVLGTDAWLLAVDPADGTERWRAGYHGECCRSIQVDESGGLRFVDGSRVVWVDPDGTEVRSEYYYADTGSSDRLEHIAPVDGSETRIGNGTETGDGPGGSIVAGDAREAAAADDARLLVLDAEGAVRVDRAVGFTDGTEFGRAVVSLVDGDVRFLLAGSALLDDGLLPWLAWIDARGEVRDHRFVVRPPDGEPTLVDVGGDDPAELVVPGRHADVECLVPTVDGFLAAYNEHDRGVAPERRRTWICVFDC